MRTSRNEEQIVEKYNTSHKAGSSPVFDIAFEREGKKQKKLLQHGVFVVGHPSRYELRGTGLNKADETWCCPCADDDDSECIFFSFLRLEKVRQREK